MSGSVKGRVIGNRLARPSTQFLIEREGSCAWCGFEVRAPKDGEICCPRCQSEEIDWITPATPVPPAATRTRDANWLPGSYAYPMFGCRVFGRR